MKNSIIFMAFLLLTAVGLQAQTAVDRYFESYSEDDRFTRVSVSAKMFSLFANFDMDDPAEQELVETVSKLKGLKMIIGEDVDGAKTIYQEAARLPSGSMEELMSVTDSEREFRFYITESGGTVSELLMVGYENRQVMILSIIGEIDLKQISKLSQKMDIDGFEHLNKISQ